MITSQVWLESLGSSLSYELSLSLKPELMAQIQVQDLDSNSTCCHAKHFYTNYKLLKFNMQPSSGM